MDLVSVGHGEVTGVVVLHGVGELQTFPLAVVVLERIHLSERRLKSVDEELEGKGLRLGVYRFLEVVVSSELGTSLFNQRATVHKSDSQSLQHVLVKLVQVQVEGENAGWRHHDT